MLLPDRNVVSSLAAARRNLDRGNPDNLLALLLNEPFQVNPLVFVLEGNKRRPPSNLEIEQQVDEALRRFKIAMPNAKIIPDRTSAIRGAIGLWEDMRPSQKRYEQFLIAAFHLLRPVGSSPSRREDVIRKLCAIAAKEDIEHLSLPFLLAWLVITLPQGKNPAMQLLKPGKREPPEQKAYNALADIRQLQLLVYASALFPGQPTALLTHDRALAEIWTGLCIKDMRMNGKKCDFSIDFGSKAPFFSNVIDSEIALFL